MNVKKILIILSILFMITGCTKLENMNYDEILNLVSIKENHTNVYRKGFKLYIPKGLAILSAGSNYLILDSSNTRYYLYIDLVSFSEKKDQKHEINNQAFFSKNINFNDINGYLEINLHENDKYLIEIMYNYAKIEVMVDKEEIKEALVNSINILKSIKYNASVIQKMLNDDNLDYTEEIFDIFENIDNNSNILDFIETEDNETNNEQLIDTDFIN